MKELLEFELAVAGLRRVGVEIVPGDEVIYLICQAFGVERECESLNDEVIRAFRFEVIAAQRAERIAELEGLVQKLRDADTGSTLPE